MDEKKKRLLIIIGCILLAILIVGGIIIILPKKNGEEISNEKELQPYVIEHDIKVLSAKDEFKVVYEPYAKDKNKNILEPAGVSFEKSIGTYKFYDYDVSDVDSNNYATYSFKYDLVIPVKFSIDTSKENEQWSKSLAFVSGCLFDYYTGDVYNMKQESLSNNITNREIFSSTDEKMNYTTITWKDKTYKIGVRMELSSKWDGVQKISSNGSIDSYSDTDRITVNVFVYAPKDYDGLMFALSNGESNKEIVLAKIRKQNRYEKLLEDEKETGVKSDELKKFEEEILNYKLLDTTHDEVTKNTKDDFYVFRINDIKTK